MKMSEGVEWGLHCAAIFAVLPAEAALSGRALAEFHGVSESYLVKHLKAMAKGGVLESISGARGGYRLARPANKITLLDVVEAIEGPEPAFRCTEIRQRGPARAEPAAYTRPCQVHVVMRRAESAWKASLRAETLAELAARVAPTLDPRSVERAVAWLAVNARGMTV